MKIKLLISLFVALGLAICLTGDALAESSIEEQPPDTLCLPGVYLDLNPECKVAGPAGYLTIRANIQKQITLQPERFPTINESYGETEYSYFRANDKNSVVFSSLNTAVANTAATDSLYEGYTFAAYTTMVVQDGKKYFQLSDGRWMRGSAVSYHAAPNQFQGVSLSYRSSYFTSLPAGSRPCLHRFQPLAQ